jgi:hypothetical protein
MAGRGEGCGELPAGDAVSVGGWQSLAHMVE